MQGGNVNQPQLHTVRNSCSNAYDQQGMSNTPTPDILAEKLLTDKLNDGPVAQEKKLPLKKHHSQKRVKFFGTRKKKEHHPNYKHEKNLKKMQNFANVLDSKFSICGVRFGLDPLFGFVPVIGDFAGIVFGTMFVLMACKYWDLPAMLLLKMCLNIMMDFVIGLVPVVGDLADVAYKSNLRNYNMLEKHVQKHFMVPLPKEVEQMV
ncbi:putative membrane protein [Zancudomyces culisetae]|uniref:Putative membrane protein n=1 Tax=Zancudomyces culisetae TaxID=1213189 RepID=A0A1R1PH94_ZANCU|nr:putative membrane protein [Zancudomyces culisetae]OMH83188.1 putative membrane protein [Zancudomyces culisetae]|eukprot:OMH80346.1 putative membrane protein [Zancudomyces culisetae]